MADMRYTQWNESLHRFVVPLLYKPEGGQIDIHVIGGEPYYAKNGAGDDICVGKDPDIVYGEFIDRLAQYENTGYGPAEIADLKKVKQGGVLFATAKNLFCETKRGGVLYKSINQIPSEYRHLFERLIKNGIIKQDINGNINISEEVFEMVLILARLGLLP